MSDRSPDPQAHATDDGPPPAVLFSLWPEAEVPLQEEVRLALEAAFPGLQHVDDLEGPEDVRWGGVYRVPGHGPGIVIWAEPRGDLAEDMLEEGLGDGPELARARKARWLLGVETVLDGRHPQRSFQTLLRVLAEATVPGIVAVYDDNALAVRSGEAVAAIAAGLVAPRARWLYAAHTVEGGGRHWVHTHGLARFSLPELDLLDVAAEQLTEAHDLVDTMVEALISGMWPDAQGRMLIGDDLPIRALRLGEGVAHFPPGIPGGKTDRVDGAGEHGGNRLVLLDASADATPAYVLRRIGRNGVLFKSPDESNRLRQLSVQRFGTFGQLFAMHRRSDWRFHVKLAFERGSCPDTREHLWFEVLELKPGRIHGRLMNRPVDVPGLTPGADRWEDWSRLTDWLIVTPQGDFDPEAAPALLRD